MFAIDTPSQFSPSSHVSITLFADRLPFLSPSLSLSPHWWMDRSCISNLAVLLMRLGAVTSLRAGEPSGAERGNGVTKRTRHLENTQKKKNATTRESAQSVCIVPRACGRLCVENKHTHSTLPSGLLCGPLVYSANGHQPTKVTKIVCDIHSCLILHLHGTHLTCNML